MSSDKKFVTLFNDEIFKTLLSDASEFYERAVVNADKTA